MLKHECVTECQSVTKWECVSEYDWQRLSVSQCEWAQLWVATTSTETNAVSETKQEDHRAAEFTLKTVFIGFSFTQRLKVDSPGRHGAQSHFRLCAAAGPPLDDLQDGSSRNWEVKENTNNHQRQQRHTVCCSVSECQSVSDWVSQRLTESGWVTEWQWMSVSERECLSVTMSVSEWQWLSVSQWLSESDWVTVSQWVWVSSTVSSYNKYNSTERLLWKQSLLGSKGRRGAVVGPPLDGLQDGSSRNWELKDKNN